MFCYGLKIYFSIIFHLYTPSTHQMSRGKGKLDFFFLHFICVVCYSEAYVWVSTYVNMYIGLLVLCKLCACLHNLFCMHCWVLLYFRNDFKLSKGRELLSSHREALEVPWCKQPSNPASGAVGLQFFWADIWADHVSQCSLHQEKEWNLCCASSARLSCI